MSHEATDRELDEFWGTPVSESQWAEATERQTRGYDEDDLADAVYENSAILLAALAATIHFIRKHNAINVPRKTAIDNIWIIFLLNGRIFIN